MSLATGNGSRLLFFLLPETLNSSIMKQTGSAAGVSPEGKSQTIREAAGAVCGIAREAVSALGRAAIPVGIAAAVITLAAMILEANGIAALASITGLSAVAAGDLPQTGNINRPKHNYNGQA